MNAKEIDKIGELQRGLLLWQENLVGVSKAVVSRVSKVCNDFQMNYLAEECLLTFSVQFSCSVVSDSLGPHESQHTRPPCPSPTTRVYPNSCPLSW